MDVGRTVSASMDKDAPASPGVRNTDYVEIVDDYWGGMMRGRTFYGSILKPIGISPYRLTGRIHAPARRIHEIVMETGTKRRMQTYGCQDISEIPQCGMNLQTH
jgi:hypothetical protein